MNGKVYLVGAGPGDPELLTLKAVRLLRQADAVLHDDLVSPQILSLVPRKAQLHDVGKRSGRKSTRQEAIHFLMIELARQGLQVVRLKGGDPLVFGRAGEEMHALRKAGIEFEVVPGVTAAFAAAASVEIPLTLRQTASSLLILTGQFADDRPLPDLRSIVKSGTTVALYMPGSNPRATVQKLAAAGIPRQTPCALVSRASTREQQATVTTLEKLPLASTQAKPSILILGEVVRHSKLGLLNFQTLSADLLPAQAAIPASAQNSDEHEEVNYA
ncbi:MAG: uroporphyrinogen-III C-methyltransferase [Acidobacteriales bacterium]|nr:uroporphyrinogen-III C-methyltransferase [Terriglobales bacterium]